MYTSPSPSPQSAANRSGDGQAECGASGQTRMRSSSMPQQSSVPSSTNDSPPSSMVNGTRVRKSSAPGSAVSSQQLSPKIR